MQRLHLDFETASKLDLKKVGLSRYMRDASTIVLCAAWAWDQRRVQSVILPTWRDIQRIFDEGSLIQNYYRISTWNAAFERAVLAHKFAVTPDARTFECTMQRALYEGLPGKLDTAARVSGALQVSMHKDMEGHRLMMQMTKPLKDGSFLHQDPWDGLVHLHRLAKYCEQDVEAERFMSTRLGYLPPLEERIVALDTKVNEFGFAVDLNLTADLMNLADRETAVLNDQCRKVTAGQVSSPGTQTARLLEWLRSRGMIIADLAKATIQEALETAVDAEWPEDVLEVLGIRAKIAKSSIRKLTTIAACADIDSRIRYSLQYYAARTGRWGGRLLQPQNLPRPAKWMRDAIRDIKQGTLPDNIRDQYGDLLNVVSNCIRGAIIPKQGCKLVVFDFAQIEARVIAWLAGQKDILRVFESGEDVYTYSAQKAGIPDGPDQRQAGKVMVLGLGFGAGAARFIEIAKTYGLELDIGTAEDMVRTWRSNNGYIVLFWQALDRAARVMLTNPLAPAVTVPIAKGVFMLVDVVAMLHERPHMLLRITLPSQARQLFYRRALLADIGDKYGPAIYYDGMEMGQWVQIKTYGAKLAENVTQAVARDIMALAALRMAERYPRWNQVLSVHDELVFEVPETELGLDPHIVLGDAIKVMEEREAWFVDLPVACEGQIMDRYGK